MTMTLVKLRYNSKLVLDPGLVLQTPLCTEVRFASLLLGGFTTTMAVMSPTETELANQISV